MDLLADFLHFGTSVFLLHVGLEQWEVWGVKSAVWSVKCEGSSGKWKVWSVECEVWSVKFQFGVRRAQCEVWSVKCEVWSVKEAVRSEKCEVLSVECEVWSVKFQFGVRRAQCEVWSVKCGVWSLKFGVRRVQCEVWSVECEVWSLECEECSVKCGVWSVKTLLRLSLKKSNGCRGKDTVGTGCLWTIGHLCLGNFRRRLARVYVMSPIFRTGKWKCSVRIFGRCATAQACGPLEFSAQNGIQAANLALAALAWEVLLPLVLTIRFFCRWWSRTGQVCNKLWGKLVKQIVRVWFVGDLSCERLGGICVAWWLSFASFVRLWCKCKLVAFFWEPDNSARQTLVPLTRFGCTLSSGFASVTWYFRSRRLDLAFGGELSGDEGKFLSDPSAPEAMSLSSMIGNQWLLAMINGCWPWTVVFALFRKWLAANFLCHAIRNCDHSSAGFDW